LAVRKPLSQLSPAYRRRVERAIAKAQAAGERFDENSPRGRARGHGSRAGKSESQLRREREAKERDAIGKPTSADRAFIRRFADKEILPRNPDMDRDEVLEQAYANMARIGSARWREQVAKQRQLRSEYVAGGGKSLNYTISDLEWWAGDDGFDDHRWYFYH
jgi:hypothetical protein